MKKRIIEERYSSGSAYYTPQIKLFGFLWVCADDERLSTKEECFNWLLDDSKLTARIVHNEDGTEGV